MQQHPQTIHREEGQAYTVCVLCLVCVCTKRRSLNVLIHAICHQHPLKTLNRSLINHLWLSKKPQPALITSSRDIGEAFLLRTEQLIHGNNETWWCEYKEQITNIVLVQRNYTHIPDFVAVIVVIFLLFRQILPDADVAWRFHWVIFSLNCLVAV